MQDSDKKPPRSPQHQLTEFAPLSPDNEKKEGFFAQLFRKKKGSREASPDPRVGEDRPGGSSSTQDVSSAAASSKYADLPGGMVDQGGRSLPSVLQRLTSLLSMKGNKKESDFFKTYWMPDSVSRECYDCGDRFTTFRRKHHCRFCGQIFCSRCCNQEVPGKVFGYSGNLRVCEYCCKVVLSYFQSSDFLGISDIKALQEDFLNKMSVVDSPDSFGSSQEIGNKFTPRRKTSEAFQEENFVRTRDSLADLMPQNKDSISEKPEQNDNATLRAVWKEICDPIRGLSLQNHRYLLQNYPSCFVGCELVEWLLNQRKASTRNEGRSLGQSLLDARMLESVSHADNVFRDGYALYRPVQFSDSGRAALFTESDRSDSADGLEPLWFKQINQNKDSEQPSQETTDKNAASAGSSFFIDLDIEDTRVSMARSKVAEFNKEEQMHAPSLTRMDSQRSNVFIYSAIPDDILAGDVIKYNAGNTAIGDDSDVRDSGPRAIDVLQGGYEEHEAAILQQLLHQQGLSSSWSSVILPLVHKVTGVIKPDIRNNNDDMDIQQYVHIKKIPGGSQSECVIVNGVVCTKNVAHKCMTQKLIDPQLLLWSVPIVYQRVEGKYLSLDPLILQEFDYLRNVVNKITSFSPDVVIVEKSVSRVAQDLIKDAGLTLVTNMKESVMERIARCTQADIVSSPETLLTRPALGMCHHMYLRVFTLPNNATKTLMFFDGCASHLGCTILLRGASSSVLKRVKKVLTFMIYVSYNWIRERSLLMDTYASPSLYYKRRFSVLSDSVFGESIQGKDSSLLSEKPDSERRSSKSSSVQLDECEEVCIPKLKDLERKTTEIVDDFSDPLHAYVEKEESLTDRSNEPTSLTAEPVQTIEVSHSVFAERLEHVLLSSSPFIKYSAPYLETEKGGRCKLRKFFPDVVYWSAYLRSNNRLDKTWKEVENTYTKLDRKCLLKYQRCGSEVRDHHFMYYNITTPIDCEENQDLLAFHRAGGGRIPYGFTSARNQKETDEIRPTQSRSDEVEDTLDPYNHQKLAVLFCSYSAHSSNAPNFCVDPWVVAMDFYGHNDISLGSFLEKYCFRCRDMSPVVPISPDTWALSFAKYLELRFYGNRYVSRAPKLRECMHSLHHECYQYFALHDTLATFKYVSIRLWEVSLPPVTVITDPRVLDVNKVVEILKKDTLSGYTLYSSVHDQLQALKGDGELGSTVKQMLDVMHEEANKFRAKLEETQLLLGQETLENCEDLMWELEDSLTRLQQFLAHISSSWNSKLGDIYTQMKRHKKVHAFEKLSSDTSLTYEEQDLEEQVNLIPPYLEVLEVQTSVSRVPRSESEPSALNKSSAMLSLLGRLGSYKDECITRLHVLENIASRKGCEAEEEGYKALESDVEESKSQKSHGRSKSEGHGITLERSGKHERREEPADSSFKAASGTGNLVPFHFSPSEHPLLPPTTGPPVIILEHEPSSIIAFGLSSAEYHKHLSDLKATKDTPCGSPVTKKKNSKDPGEVASGMESRKTSVLNFLRSSSTLSSESKYARNEEQVLLSVSPSKHESSAEEEFEDIQPKVSGKGASEHHIELQWSDSSTKFYCKVYYAEQFRELRKQLFPKGEDRFIHSLAHCLSWAAKGGKSGSIFCKTYDDRFILKEMNRFEIQSFLNFAHHYFTYITRAALEKKPTLLAKILGVYRIGFKNSQTNSQSKMDLLVMENLFYSRKIVQKFDLKGSVRNRLVNTENKNEEADLVLLDENLLKMACDNPLYIRPHSKTILSMAIDADTVFLSSQAVMDYSLLVGVDEDNGELVLGIIDYIRTFTWDKRLEMVVKSTGILGGQGKLPTVVYPELYRGRFRDAMAKYFLPVPDKWSGLGRGVYG